jgi:hypothetical protein
MLTKLKYLSMVVGLVFCLCQNGSAELAAVGPVDSTNGFPSSYVDEDGLSLQLCLTSSTCTFDAPISGNAFSQLIGFGQNAFYWSADADLTGTGVKGSLRMALAASFSGSTIDAIPANGEQVTFFQIVVSPLTGLTAGSVYTVTYPYGVLTNLVADSSGTIPIQRQDIGCAAAPCDFTAVLGSVIGPFLQWDTGAPAGFVGNPAIAHPVVGSPFGTNIFRIDGPNAGGPGVDTKQTNLFKVQGKSSTGTLPTPLVVGRATYTRPLPPKIEVLAASSPSASLTVSWTGASPVAMITDGSGKFFANILNPVSFPSSVTVTARQLDKTNTTVASNLVDIITITSADFHPVAKTLTIEASSSDQVVPLPTLTAVGFGDLTAIPGDFPNQKRVVTGLTVPPAEVTVLSSAGGVATSLVSVIARPLAKNDSALTLRTTDDIIDVLANDIAYPLGIGILDPATVTVVTAPKKGTITSVDPATGKVTYTPTPASFTKRIENDTFKYTVEDSFGQESNAATVTVTVAASETLTVTKAVFTTSTKRWQMSGKSTVKSGNVITLYLGSDTTGPVIGTAKVNAFGGWSFSKLNSPVDPGGATSITAQSSLGTVVTFLLTIM